MSTPAHAQSSMNMLGHMQYAKERTTASVLESIGTVTSTKQRHAQQTQIMIRFASITVISAH